MHHTPVSTFSIYLYQFISKKLPYSYLKTKTKKPITKNIKLFTNYKQILPYHYNKNKQNIT